MPRKQEQGPQGHIHNSGSQCSWRTDGRQCFLTGSISPDYGDHARRYCHWHYVCIHRPEDRGNYDEFCRWNARWQGYCSEENHSTDQDIWAAIQGRNSLGKPSQWCGVIGCRHFPREIGARVVKPVHPGPAIIHNITTELSPTQYTHEELDRQKAILRDMAGQAISNGVPF